jgi:hypothetical protein
MATVNLGSIKFKWKGTYSGATAYTVDDVVEYNGSSYICKLASTGNLPTNTTYFDVMSSAGTNGTNGTDVGTVITTQGDLLYRDGSGLQRLGAGTSGYFLKTQGAGANPTWAEAPSGTVKQALTKTANYDFGTIGNTSPYHLSALDITFTATETNPLLFLNGEVLTDNSNSGSFGVDLGFEIYNNTDSTTKWAFKPNQHPSYNDTTSDQYRIATKTILWDSSGVVSHGVDQSGSSGWITAGDSITARIYIRCNNSNMTYFGGNNGTTNHCQLAQVWEIKQ